MLGEKSERKDELHKICLWHLKSKSEFVWVIYLWVFAGGRVGEYEWVHLSYVWAFW